MSIHIYSKSCHLTKLHHHTFIVAQNMGLLSVFDNTLRLQPLKERRLLKWGNRKKGLKSTILVVFFLTIALTILLGHSLSNTISAKAEILT